MLCVSHVCVCVCVSVCVCILELESVLGQKQGWGLPSIWHTPIHVQTTYYHSQPYVQIRVRSDIDVHLLILHVDMYM